METGGSACDVPSKGHTKTAQLLPPIPAWEAPDLKSLGLRKLLLTKSLSNCFKLRKKREHHYDKEMLKMNLEGKCRLLLEFPKAHPFSNSLNNKIAVSSPREKLLLRKTNK